MNDTKKGLIYNQQHIKHDTNIWARYSLIFILLLPCFVPMEAASLIILICAAFCIIMQNYRIKKGLLILVLPFFFLVLIGMVNAWNHQLYDVVKDVWYVGKVIAGVAIGYLFARYVNDFSEIYRIVIVSAVIAAVVHLLQIAFYYSPGESLFYVRDTYEVRGYFITIIGLAFLLSIPRRDFSIKSRNVTYVLWVILCFTSLLVALSRTHIILFFVIMLTLKGWWYLSAKNVMRIFITFSFGLLILVVLPVHDLAGRSVLDKFVHGYEEIAIQDYDNLSELHVNWRGFESYRALKEFEESDYFQKVLGQGFGATVDLGFYMTLAGVEFRYLPVLHNGYMYVLIKYGLLGLLLYLFFVMKLVMGGTFLRQRPERSDDIYMSRFISAMGWCLLLSTLVIAGAFNKSVLDSALILIGLVTGVRNKYIYYAGGIKSAPSGTCGTVNNCPTN